MSEPFVGEIRIFGYNFAPRGWAECDGQLLPISQNTALFSLLGTMYGGDGKTNFALPDLQGRAPMMWGQGPGLTDRTEGEVGGVQTVTLTTSEMPQHAHGLEANSRGGRAGTPAGNAFAGSTGGSIYRDASPDVTMAPDALAPTGDGFAHDNMQPSLTLMFCIALEGIFPPRS